MAWDCYKTAKANCHIAQVGFRLYLQVRYIKGVAQDTEFDWDPANLRHVARHKVQPEEAEQVIVNEPLDIGVEVVDGEERFLSLGSTTKAHLAGSDDVA